MNETVIRAIKALRDQNTPIKEVEAIIAEMEGWDLDAETARADAAEAKVCELVEAAGKAKTELAHCVHIMGRKGGLYEEALEGLTAALASTADIRAKWCPVSERDDAQQIVCEMREIILEAADDLDRDNRRHMESGDGLDVSNTEHTLSRGREVVARAMRVAGRWVEVPSVITAFTEAGLALGVHSTMGLDAHIKRIVDDSNATIRERDEVGVQLVAAQAEIARLTKGIADVRRFMLATWRPPAEAVLGLVEELIAGGTSVPGDEGAPWGVQFDDGTWEGRDDVGVLRVSPEKALRFKTEKAAQASALGFPGSVGGTAKLLPLVPVSAARPEAK